MKTKMRGTKRDFDLGCSGSVAAGGNEEGDPEEPGDEPMEATNLIGFLLKPCLWTRMHTHSDTTVGTVCCVS